MMASSDNAKSRQILGANYKLCIIFTLFTLFYKDWDWGRDKDDAVLQLWLIYLMLFPGRNRHMA